MPHKAQTRHYGNLGKRGTTSHWKDWERYHEGKVMLMIPQKQIWWLRGPKYSCHWEKVTKPVTEVASIK